MDIEDLRLRMKEEEQKKHIFLGCFLLTFLALLVSIF